MSSSRFGPTRRSLVQGALASGAGLALLPALSEPAAAEPAGRPGRSRDAAGDHQFTVVVMPDTQYLFDGTGNRPAPVTAALDHVKRRRETDNIVFLGHLGDLTP